MLPNVEIEKNSFAKVFRRRLQQTIIMQKLKS